MRNVLPRSPEGTRFYHCPRTRSSSIPLLLGSRTGIPDLLRYVKNTNPLKATFGEIRPPDNFVIKKKEVKKRDRTPSPGGTVVPDGTVIERTSSRRTNVRWVSQLLSFIANPPLPPITRGSPLNVLFNLLHHTAPPKPGKEETED